MTANHNDHTNTPDTSPNPQKITVSPLRQTDEISVREWAVDYLKSYIGHYVSMWDLSIADIGAHIDDHDLESALWHDVMHADYGDNEFVGVLREGIAPIGLILVTEKIDPYVRTRVAQLRWIYIVPKHRGQRLASRLFDAAEKWMQARGIRHASTALATNNQAALSAYERHGFEIAENRLLRTLSGA